MIPASFEYERAESVAEAIELLGRHGEDAKVLAGGQSLLPLLKLRLVRPTVLVDLGRVPDLSYVREDGDRVAIGAMTTYADAAASDVLSAQCPLLAKAASEVGDPQVRHMGTVGGGAAHADPAGDVPAALLALDAELVAQGPGGKRTIPAREFFRSVFETALAPGEVLTEIRVPRHGGARWSYLKFHPRGQDWAIVGVAAYASNGSSSVVLTNMGATPMRAAGVEQALAGGADAASAAEHAADGTEPTDDVFASAEYRRELAKVLVRRALEELGSG